MTTLPIFIIDRRLQIGREQSRQKQLLFHWRGALKPISLVFFFFFKACNWKLLAKTSSHTEQRQNSPCISLDKQVSGGAQLRGLDGRTCQLPIRHML